MYNLLFKRTVKAETKYSSYKYTLDIQGKLQTYIAYARLIYVWEY